MEIIVLFLTLIHIIYYLCDVKDFISLSKPTYFMYKKKETLREAMYSRSLQVDKKMDLNWLTKEYKLTELDFKGTFFKNWPIKLAGNTDVLSLGRPDIIEEVHRKSLESGADIVTTNTIMSQSLCQKKYGLNEEKYVEFLNRASVRIAQFEANKMSAKTPDKPRFVIGSVGPTSKMLSKYGVGDSDTIDATFDTLEEAYIQQMKIMILEGVDAIMVEGVTDTLNAKAAISAFMIVKDMYKHIYHDFNGKDYNPEIMLSALVMEDEKYTKSGQTRKAFINSVRHANPLYVGFNCRGGDMTELSTIPRQNDKYDSFYHLSNMEALDIAPQDIVISEACDVRKNRVFEGMVERHDREECLAMVRKEIENKANVIKINVDLEWVDQKSDFHHIIKAFEEDPIISKAILMLSSSNFEVLEYALKNAQGRCLVDTSLLSTDPNKRKEQLDTIFRLGGEAFGN